MLSFPVFKIMSLSDMGAASNEMPTLGVFFDGMRIVVVHV